MSNKVLTSFPVAGMTGHISGSQTVMFVLKGQTYMRAYVTPANPQSTDQVKVRDVMASVSKAYQNLTIDQQTAWQQFADAQYGYTENGKFMSISGSQCFNKLNVIRNYMGLASLTDPPTLGPPVPLTGLTPVAGQPAQDHAFTVSHEIGAGDLALYKLLVKCTPPTKSAGTEPRYTNAMYIKGVGTGSFAALPATGQNSTFADVRFPCQNDQRYGTLAYIVRIADGQLSAPFWITAVKTA